MRATVYHERHSEGTTASSTYPDILEKAKMRDENRMAVTDKGLSSEEGFAKHPGLGHGLRPQVRYQIEWRRLPKGTITHTGTPRRPTMEQTCVHGPQRGVP